MSSPHHIIELLCSYRKKNSSVFNPWVEACEFDLGKKEFKNRQRRLIQHLSIPQPRFILIGEAAGYQGCRYSGVTFTSEKILLNEGVPRIERLERRITNRDLPFNEPSATIVWSALKKNCIADQVILWNTFPFHPMRDLGIHTNRTPTNAELDDGGKILEELLSLYRIRPKLIAVGKKAESVLAKIGIPPIACVRHPAFGGANEFREGIERVAKTPSA